MQNRPETAQCIKFHLLRLRQKVPVYKYMLSLFAMLFFLCREVTNTFPLTDEFYVHPFSRQNVFEKILPVGCSHCNPPTFPPVFSGTRKFDVK